MPRRRASRSHSASSLAPVYRYFGGAGTEYVARELSRIMDAAEQDPLRALHRLQLFLATLPVDVAKRAWKAMSEVQVAPEIVADVEAAVVDGVIDEVEAQSIVARERARYQLLAALLEISDWLHDALFVKTQYLTEVPGEEE